MGGVRLEISIRMFCLEKGNSLWSCVLESVAFHKGRRTAAAVLL